LGQSSSKTEGVQESNVKGKQYISHKQTGQISNYQGTKNIMGGSQKTKINKGRKINIYIRDKKNT